MTCIHYTENKAYDEICIRGITIKFDTDETTLIFNDSLITYSFAYEIFSETWEFGTIGHVLFWESLKSTFPRMLNYNYRNLLKPSYELSILLRWIWY